MSGSSVFSSLSSKITKKAVFLSLAIAGTSATGGGVASYFLFSDENREQAKEEKRTFEGTAKLARNERFAKVFTLMKEQVKLKKQTDCLKKEMAEHDKSFGLWGKSNHTPNFKYCRSIKVA